MPIKPTVRKACREAVRQYVAEELGGLEKKTARFQYLFRSDWCAPWSRSSTT